MISNPFIYEINTRVWLKNFNNKRHNAKILDVPIYYWKSLKNLGIDYIWLMGVWKTRKTTIKKYCLTDDLISEYRKALPDFTNADVVGSPYSIDKYVFNPEIGTKEDFVKLKIKLNKIGLGLILDFIPNHFSADTTLLKSKPSIFLQASIDFINQDKETFFESPFQKEIIFAHGKDPYFSAWTDTIQINYFNEESCGYMSEQLIKISEYCDGVRCDMAMLVLNDVFEKTWYDILSAQNYNKQKDEFWEIAIKRVKKKKPNFIFVGEVYWDLEWKLQKLGFDYTYDKKLYDRLIEAKPYKLREHLLAEDDYQKKSLRFIENHDEKRAIRVFGEEKSEAAAFLVSTINGAKLFFNGQFEGQKIKLPVQLSRAPFENTNKNIKQFYNTLLSIVKKKIFKDGKWKLIEISPINQSDESYKNILTWSWVFKSKVLLIAINYSLEKSKCIIKEQFDDFGEEVIFNDILNHKSYTWKKVDLIKFGLYIELEKYQSRIFLIKKEK